MEILIVLCLLVVVILQLITISKLAESKSRGRGPQQGQRRPDGVGGEGRPEKKDGGQRNGGGRKPGESRGDKPQQQPRQGGSGPRQQGQGQPAQGGDSGATLRDINLRLKNAEREQENVRKRIHDGPGNAGGGQREERGQRDGPRDGPRDGHRDGPRDGHRDGRPQQQQRGGNNRNDRNDRGGGDRGGRRDHPGGGGRDQRPRHEGGEGQPHDRPQRPFPPAEQQFADTGVPSFTDTAVIEAGAAEELQHGRKFTAKRRQLPENGAEGAPESESMDMHMPMPPVAEYVNADVHMTDQPQHDDGADIQFGRGRR